MAILYDYAVKYGGKYYKPMEPIVECADNASKSALEAVAHDADTNISPKPEAVKKSTRARKKGDA